MLQNPHDLDDKYRIDLYFIAIPSMFSFVGCVVVVCSILLLKKLRTVTFMIIGVQMTGEGLYNLVSAVFLYPPEEDSILCTIQGYALVWTLNVMILMTAFMGYHMRNMIKRKTAASYSLTGRKLLKVTGIVVLYSTVVATVPLFRGGYEFDDAQCWVSSQTSHFEFTVINLCVLYGPLWACIIYSMMCYWTIFKFVREISQASTDIRHNSRYASSDSEASSQRTEKVVLKLMYYPAIMTLCWTGITLTRVYLMICPSCEPRNLYLWLSHGLLQLQGVFDTAVFVSYSSVQTEYHTIIGRMVGVEMRETLTTGLLPGSTSSTNTED